MIQNKGDGTFWEHLDVLRTVIIKIIAVWVIFSVVAFLFKEEMFRIILAPKENSFITYSRINMIGHSFGLEPVSPIHLQLINTALAQQFIIHIQAAMCVGLILSLPFALYEIFKFISPALYESERRYSLRLIISGYVMFISGVALSYFIIFPMTFQFLGAYQVAPDVMNMISLESYISTLIMLSLWMGVLCELPVLAWLLSRMGFINADILKKYRRHAFVIILVAAAVITPTSDIFTLLLVSLPICLLYEFSILISHPQKIFR